MSSSTRSSSWAEIPLSASFKRVMLEETTPSLFKADVCSRERRMVISIPSLYAFSPSVTATTVSECLWKFALQSALRRQESHRLDAGLSQACSCPKVAKVLRPARRVPILFLRQAVQSCFSTYGTDAQSFNILFGPLAPVPKSFL
jgi:hypothetical protein